MRTILQNHAFESHQELTLAAFFVNVSCLLTMKYARTKSKNSKLTATAATGRVEALGMRCSVLSLRQAIQALRSPR